MLERGVDVVLGSKAWNWACRIGREWLRQAFSTFYVPQGPASSGALAKEGGRWL